MIQAVMNRLIESFQNTDITASLYLSMMLMVVVCAVYEFFVYQVVMRRSLYNKAFNVSITVLPFFVATIILCLQSNMVVTLGTIGALAIIRFRTAVKDPIDLIFLLWSIHTGITCGCQLYELALGTSILVTIVLIVINFVSMKRKTHILVVHTKVESDEKELIDLLGSFTKRFRVKSRNYTNKGMDYVFEVSGKDAVALSDALKKYDAVERFSLMEYDTDDTL